MSVLTLNRPEAKNAIGRQLLRELAEALDILRQERTTRCVIIRSNVPGRVGEAEGGRRADICTSSGCRAGRALHILQCLQQHAR